MKEVFLPLGAWTPDNHDRDNPDLSVAENLLPLYRNYRLVPELILKSSTPILEDPHFPLTGGIAHLIDSNDSKVIVRPFEDTIVDQGYVNENNESIDLFDSINETDVDVNDFVITRNVVDVRIYKVKLQDPGIDPPVDDSHVLRVWMFWLNDSGTLIEIVFSLFEGNTVVGDLIADPVTRFISDSDVGGRSLRQYEIKLSNAQANDIGDYSNLFLVWDVDLFLNTNQTNYFPVRDISHGNSWKNGIGGDNDYFNKVDGFNNDTFPGNAVQFQTLTQNNQQGVIRFGLQTNITDPIIHDTYELRLRARGIDNNCKAKVRLHKSNGDIIVAHQFENITTTMTTHIHVLTDEEMDNIDSFNNLEISVVAQWDSPEGNTVFEMSTVAFQIPKGKSAVLVQAEFEMPGIDSQVETDVVRRYVGDQESLWEIPENTDTWTDVSRLAKYAQGTILPQSWNFVSWGDDVFATNFIDAVQLKVENNLEFIDSITSDNKPRAKYIGAVQDHVMLANINPADVATLMPDFDDVGIVPTSYMIMWSAANNGRRFELANLTVQSSFMELRDTPGQITGFIGGEFGLAFKRNSIYRINYVGPPFTFGRDLLSVNIGCYYPRSIIPVGQDVYFIGNGGIYLIQQGQNLIRIGTDKVLRFLFDTEYELDAIEQGSTVRGMELDSSVVGAYDSYTDTIWWLYQNVGSVPHNSNRIILYSIREDRFSFINLDDATDVVDEDLVTSQSPVEELELFDHIQGEMNTVSSVQALSRAVMIFTRDGVDDALVPAHKAWQFISPNTLAATFTSKILSAHYISGKKFINIQINFVRFVFTVSKNAPINTGATLDFRASENPLLKLGFKQSSTLDSVADEDGWLALNPPLTGEYFEWELHIPSFAGNNIRELIGIDIRFEEAGKH